MARFNKKLRITSLAIMVFVLPILVISVLVVKYLNSRADESLVFSTPTPASYECGSTLYTNYTTNLFPRTKSTKAGGSLTYYLVITNTEPSKCPKRNFYISVPSHSIPVGWNFRLAKTGVSLNPGQSITTTVTYISPKTAVKGDYDVGVIVSVSQDGTQGGNGSTATFRIY